MQNRKESGRGTGGGDSGQEEVKSIWPPELVRKAANQSCYSIINYLPRRFFSTFNCNGIQNRTHFQQKIFCVKHVFLTVYTIHSPMVTAVTMKSKPCSLGYTPCTPGRFQFPCKAACKMYSRPEEYLTFKQLNDLVCAKRDNYNRRKIN